MATVTQRAAGAWVADAATVWNTAAVPAIGDDVVPSLDYALQIDDDSNALASFARTAGTGSEALQIDNAKSLDVDGNATFDGEITGTGRIEVSGDCTFTLDMTDLPSTITLTLNGTGDLRANGVSVGAVVISTAGTHTAVDVIAASRFQMSSGASTYVDGGFAHNIAGNILFISGTLTSTGTWWPTASGTVRFVTSSLIVNHLIAGSAGVVTSMSDVVHCRELTIGPGSGGNAFVGSEAVNFHVDGDDKWHQPATAGAFVPSAMNIILSGNREVGRIDVSGSSARLKVKTDGGNFTLTMTGDIICGTQDLEVGAETNGAWAAVDMAEHDLVSCDDVFFGTATKSDYGKIDLGTGRHTFTDLLRKATNTSSSHEVDFGSSHTTLAGTIDGTNIVADNTNACVAGGTIDDVDLSGKPALMHIYPASAGSNNVNVTEVDLPFGYAAGITTLRLMGRVKQSRRAYRSRGR